MNKILTITMDIIKNDMKYLFTLPYGAPYEHVYEVLEQIASHVKQFESDAKTTASDVQTVINDIKVVTGEASPVTTPTPNENKS